MNNSKKTKFRIKDSDSGRVIWSEARRCYVALTPEEGVRQELVYYLTSTLNIPITQIVEEYPVEINGQHQRADIVILTPSCRAALLVECKAPDIKLSQSTLDQVVRYNSVIKARYIMITNGCSTHLYQYSAQDSYSPISKFPSREQLFAL